MTTPSTDLDTRWKPPVTGRLARECVETARRTGAGALAAPITGDPSLGGGAAGRAVGLSYLARAWPSDGFSEGIETLLDSAVERVAGSNLKVGLMQGFTGVAWALSHLYPDDDGTEEIEETLIESLSRSVWPGEYDLISGLVGIGVYGLERFPRGRSEELLSLVVERLADRSEPTAAGLAWFTPPEFILASRLGRAPKGFYNLGMAHGLPGVVALLSALVGRDIQQRRVTGMLEGAVGELLATRLPADSTSTWPYFLGEDVDVMPTRLAWCYGDPGVTCALVQAGRSLERAEWLSAADDAVDRMFERAPGTEGVSDVSICHGTAGLMLMSARLYEQTGDERFVRWAERWASETVAAYDEEEELGYSVWDPEDDKGGDVQGPGLLAGTTGVAAALLAVATDVAPAWDRALLISTGAGR